MMKYYIYLHQNVKNVINLNLLDLHIVIIVNNVFKEEIIIVFG